MYILKILLRRFLLIAGIIVIVVLICRTPPYIKVVKVHKGPDTTHILPSGKPRPPHTKGDLLPVMDSLVSIDSDTAGLFDVKIREYIEGKRVVNDSMIERYTQMRGTMMSRSKDGKVTPVTYTITQTNDVKVPH